MPPETSEQKFPTLQIFGILLASLLTTALLLWFWHIITLHILNRSLSDKNEGVRKEIITLTKMRDEHKHYSE